MTDPMVLILMYFVVPLWIVAGFLDWCWHRRSGIERTSGPIESALHALMFVQVGLILLPGLFLEINATVILVMIGALVWHEVTALADVQFAREFRHISTLEHATHSILEMIPLTAILGVISLHWNEFLVIFYGPFQWSLQWKVYPLPIPYLSTISGAIILFAFIPYVEEFYRCWRYRT